LLLKVNRLERALLDADAASAALRHRMAELQKAAHDSARRADAAQQAAEDSQRKGRHDLEAAQQDANLRVKLLEETVHRLGSSDEQSADIVWLSSQLSSVQRSEARMRTDLVFAEQRVLALSSELDDARAKQLASPPVAEDSSEVQDLLPGVYALQDAAVRAEEQRKQHDQLVSSLAERAEKAEVELGQAQAELTKLQVQLKRSRGAQAQGSNAIVSASKVRAMAPAAVWGPVLLHVSVPSLPWALAKCAIVRRPWNRECQTWSATRC
jgi:chromosome segregation ATPase